nr:MAG TPA: hypothetical protein [Caudoviricetes sp.]
MAVPRLLRGCGRGSTRDNTVHQGSRRAETHTDTAAILYLCGHNNARSRIFYRSTHSLCGSPAPGQCDNHRDLGKRRIRCAPLGRQERETRGCCGRRHEQCRKHRCKHCAIRQRGQLRLQYFKLCARKDRQSI